MTQRVVSRRCLWQLFVQDLRIQQSVRFDKVLWKTILISVHFVIINQASLPDFWRAIALRLWPAYYDPEVGRGKVFPTFLTSIHTLLILTG